MHFTWDSRKSEENHLRRRIGLAVAARIFEGFNITHPDIRRDYGELRMVAIGVVAGIELTVVYTDRRNVNDEIERRIISARRSNRKERRAYEERAKES